MSPPPPLILQLISPTILLVGDEAEAAVFLRGTFDDAGETLARGFSEDYTKTPLGDAHQLIYLPPSVLCSFQMSSKHSWIALFSPKSYQN